MRFKENNVLDIDGNLLKLGDEVIVVDPGNNDCYLEQLGKQFTIKEIESYLYNDTHLLTIVKEKCMDSIYSKRVRKVVELDLTDLPF